MNGSFFFAREIGTHYKPISRDHGIVKRFSLGDDLTVRPLIYPLGLEVLGGQSGPTGLLDRKSRKVEELKS
jgi:hypothetical protein